MLRRLPLLLLLGAVPVASAAHATGIGGRRYGGAGCGVRCAPACCRQPSSSSPKELPLALRCLTRQEILGRLNAVPTFSVSSGALGLLATAGDDDDEPSCRFYLELSDARATVDALRAANPTAEIELAVVPLGTAFALCEWQEQADEEWSLDALPEAAGALADEDAWLFDEAMDDDDDDFEPAAPGWDLDDDGDEIGSYGELYQQAELRQLERDFFGVVPASGAGASDGEGLFEAGGATSLRASLVGSREELECARAVLGSAPVPPLLRRRNAREGAIPLFGFDELRFRRPAATANATATATATATAAEPGTLKAPSEDAPAEALAAGGQQVEAEAVVTPLFFHRRDLYAAWSASAAAGAASGATAGGTGAGGGVAGVAAAAAPTTTPPLRVTDLRTLAHRMEFDTGLDYRSVVLVAPKEARDFVERAQRDQGDEESAPAEA